jgi:hypothetical protein
LIYIEKISLLLEILGPEKRADIAPRGATERVVYRLAFVLQQKVIQMCCSKNVIELTYGLYIMASEKINAP